MKIETIGLKELSYGELVSTKKSIERDIECGDIILIKEKDSDVWDTQFVTMITNIGIYLHSDSNGMDGGGIIFWPEYMEKQNMEKQKLYNSSKFIHIPTKNEEGAN